MGIYTEKATILNNTADTVGKGDGETNWESGIDTHTIILK